MTGRDGTPPRIVPRAEHPISRSRISRNAVKVLYRLHNAGFKAYLVGGSVRDLFLGRTPKDYDAGTDARPSEIRRLFRNSRIIGRRFRLVHVFFQEEIIEVSTFRQAPDPTEQESEPGELLITSDNVYGSPEEDAFRRDFTVNGLFYNIADFSVIDYVGGIHDLEHQRIRAIGNPGVRFREDPVRMLRACEFAARLGFGIEDRTQEGILEQRGELEKASSARMTEELIQLLKCGHSGAAVQWMLDLGLVEHLVPEIFDMLEAGRRGFDDLSRILPVLDGLAAEEKENSDGLVLGALLLPTVLVRLSEAEKKSGHPLSRSRIETVVQQAIRPFEQRFNLSNARSRALSGALTTFQLLCEPQWTPAGRRRLASRGSFRDALGLFDLMVQATGSGQEALDDWRRAARDPLPEPEPEPSGAIAPERRRSRRGRRRRRRGKKRN